MTALAFRMLSTPLLSSPLAERQAHRRSPQGAGLWKHARLGLLLCCAAGSALWAQKADKERDQAKPPRNAGVFHTEYPAHDLDLILGRPTDHSVTLSILSYRSGDSCRVEWEPLAGGPLQSSPVQQLSTGEPAELCLRELNPDTGYRYRIVHLPAAQQGGSPVAEGWHSFHTARSPGSSFVVTITADSHLDGNSSPALYDTCLRRAAADHPDFHIDLGDTFMTEKRRNYQEALPQYRAQRYHFGLLADSAPLFLVLGNHDGEGARTRPGDEGSMALWANLTRKHFFPNPEPDAFYSGNSHRDPKAGLLQDYYAWTWGDALFVVLDPFWYSTPAGKKDRAASEEAWSRSLGKDQYAWLEATLAASQARYRFLFIHHLVGGIDRQSRGGVEAAGLYEWGGHEPGGADRFAQERPGWTAPIHALLLKYHVTAVFHGHDHLYARQDLDGILYQEVPQPGAEHEHRGGQGGQDGKGEDRRSAKSAEKGDKGATDQSYHQGRILPGSGYLRLRLTPDAATVEFLRSNLGTGLADVADSVTLKPWKATSAP